MLAGSRPVGLPRRTGPAASGIPIGRPVESIADAGMRTAAGPGNRVAATGFISPSSYRTFSPAPAEALLAGRHIVESCSGRNEMLRTLVRGTWHTAIVAQADPRGAGSTVIDADPKGAACRRAPDPARSGRFGTLGA
ncbi:hypothetical protein IU433_10970 [Nocardia puris]|uniref:hypothetical protein n=1 Tax=Nocardia puris TaxID=208602 RepID=UPI001893966F|nr:hypothetical protein [Nocardia puris]MBF6211033.1 hypothetical protein [Nocardia puris]MBF6364629.1 hypothetical protein [Nocardia puris]MBF6459558.1 hypothetical protein [Nocardia puris]